MTSNSQHYDVLIVDDDPDFLASLSTCLRSNKITNFATLTDACHAPEFLHKNTAATILLDIRMPIISGNELLVQLLECNPHQTIIMMSGINDIEVAIECMKKGARDFIVKPPKVDRLITTLKNGIESYYINNQNIRLREMLLNDRIERPEIFGDILTSSPKMLRIFQYITAIASTSKPVLITGETGTGKEMLAKAIHAASGLRGGFVSINVAAQGIDSLDDTLYGHVRGAYAGAETTRDGMVAKAAGGTLYLDEIGDLSDSSMAKLLRLVRDDEYYSLGSDLTKQNSARIIAATNRDYMKLPRGKDSRTVLYYHLSVLSFHVPALRDRPEDIPILIRHFAEDAAKNLCRPPVKISDEIFELLSTYGFPGNVLELSNIMRNLVAHAGDSNEIMSKDLELIVGLDVLKLKAKSGIKIDTNPLQTVFGKFPTAAELEEWHIRKAMELCNNNQSAAARLLELSRPTIINKLKQMGFNTTA